jgi:hypothetical protein
MADWDSLRNYIKANYKIAEDSLDSVKLIFDLDGNRSQAVIVNRVGDTGWASISTAVCEADKLDARAALLRNSQMIIGALAMVENGPIIFRHSFPLENLDINEFEEPLRTAVMYGDRLELELTGEDKF